MKKLEIGPSVNGSTPDGQKSETWDTADSHYSATHRCTWGSQPMPIADNTYDWVHASHVLEHIPWWLTAKAVEDVYRILKPGGRFTVWVPDGVEIMLLALEDPEELRRRESSWRCAGLNPQEDPWVYVNARLFWGARPGEIGQEQHWHRAIFGKQYLHQVLRNANFSNVRIIKRDTAVDPGHGWMEVGAEGYK